MFASRICCYLIGSILPSISEVFPVPLAATQGQSMMDPPPCLTAGEVEHFVSRRATVSVLDVKMEHTLLCVLELFFLNTLLCGHAAAQKPRPTLTADNYYIRNRIPVTLTCSVEGSAGWKYDWFRRTSYSSAAQPVKTGEPHNVLSVSKVGLYYCRGGRGDPSFFTENSTEVSIQETVSNTVILTLQPNRREIFSGEAFTVRCEIQESGGTGWTYGWTPAKLNTPPTRSEHRISRATVSDGGDYRCYGIRDSFTLTEWSNIITLRVSHNKPKAELSAADRHIPVGGSATLTCSVKPSSSGWKYFWYRGEKTSKPLTTQDVVFNSNGKISVSQEGVYWCRGGRGEPVYYTEYSDSVGVYENTANKAVVTLQPNWSEIYRGETITLRCEVKDGGDTGWEYEWKTTSSQKPSNHNEHSISYAYTSHSGDYRCRGRNSAQQSSTEWSDPITLTVSDKKPVLTVSPSWLTPGDSVTLNCEVEHPSAGWRFYWFKAVPQLSASYYRYELLPGSSSGTEQDSFTVHGQTHTAGYNCKAGRGDPVHYTRDSELKFVWSGDFHSSASLTVSPDRVQHFTSNSVSLSCEGNSTEWRVRRSSDDSSTSLVSYCSFWGTMTGPTCKIDSNQQSDAVYWCESGSGEFSNAVNITRQKTDIILVSPVHPVTEGDSVSLSCILRRGFVSNVFFYRNGELIQNDTRRERNISAVSKSDEGFYKCQQSQNVSAQSWMSVKSVSRPEGSSVPVPLIIGLVCGIALIILLLLMYRYRPSKDSCFIRSNQSESTNQGPDTNRVVNQNEAQGGEYSTLLHGDVSVYETIKSPEDTENDESQDVAHSSIELKDIGKKRRRHEPVETVYSNVTIGTAGL